jgi:hypothetical protein
MAAAAATDQSEIKGAFEHAASVGWPAAVAAAAVADGKLWSDRRHLRLRLTLLLLLLLLRRCSNRHLPQRGRPWHLATTP